MLKKLLVLSACSASLLAPFSVFADHNSKWGEGWANMPNDVHNTRIDTRGDNTAFRDFVRYGNGAESENRFDTSDSRGRRDTSAGSGNQQRSRISQSTQNRHGGGGHR